MVCRGVGLVIGRDLRVDIEACGQVAHRNIVPAEYPADILHRSVYLLLPESNHVTIYRVLGLLHREQMQMP